MRESAEQLGQRLIELMLSRSRRKEWGPESRRKSHGVKEQIALPEERHLSLLMEFA